MDVACLDGWEAFETYKATSERYGSYRPVVILTGKQDTPTTTTPGHLTGIALNTLDTPEEVLAFLKNEGIDKKDLVVRPHPSMHDNEQKR